MRIFPEGPYFGLTRRRYRKILRGLLIAVVAIFALYISARAFLYLEARRATDLLAQLKLIKIGQPSSSLAPMFDRFEDHEHERLWKPGNHTIVSVNPWHFYGTFSRFAWMDQAIREVLFQSSSDMRRRLGLRVWHVAGSLSYSEARVESVDIYVAVEGENEWLVADSTLVANISNRVLDRPEIDLIAHPEMAKYFAHWSHLHMGYETGEVLVNVIASDADPVQMRAGREINLSCLTSRKGCRSLCDLMPEASTYRHEHDYPKLGWNSGSWGRQDEICE